MRCIFYKDKIGNSIPIGSVSKENQETESYGGVRQERLTTYNFEKKNHLY